MKTDFHNAVVLVTGGAGFVGSHLVDKLVELGAREIRVLDDLSRGRLENLQHAMSSGCVKFYQGDVRQEELVLKLAQGCEYIYHLAAWRITRCESQPREALEVMVTGTYNVLEASARAHVKRVIYASSASVYGQATEFPTPESHSPYGNETLYGWAKLFGEGLVKWYVSRGPLSGICLRFFNIYGPRMDLEGKYTEVMIRWMEALLEGKPPVIHGDGSARYDFVHVRDVVRACILATVASVDWGIYNVASGTETSLLELARLLAALLGRPDLKPCLLPERQPSVYRRCGDLSAVRRDLGYEPSVTLCEGLADLVSWYVSKKYKKEHYQERWQCRSA